MFIVALNHRISPIDKIGNSLHILEAHVKENQMDVWMLVGSQVVDEIIDLQYDWGEHTKL